MVEKILVVDSLEEVLAGLVSQQLVREVGQTLSLVKPGGHHVEEMVA